VTLKKYLPNGQLVYGKWEFRGITDGAGQITEILCTGYDITPLMESIDRAETLLNLTAIQNARLRSFAYIVSHNIRSHATNLISLVDLMRQPQSQAEQPAFMDMLQTSVHRLDNTLRDLNQVISVTDATELDWKEVHIHEAVNVVMQTVQGQMTALKGELNWHFKEALTLWTSPPFFESILLNLVSNAIKYRKPLLPPKIDVWMEKTEEHFTLRIQDKGVGIDLEKYGDKLFGMYKTWFIHYPRSGRSPWRKHTSAE
jgi:signal transduction histidine kinase